MRRSSRIAVIASLAAAVQLVPAAAGYAASAPAPAPLVAQAAPAGVAAAPAVQADELTDRLSAIPGMRVISEQAAPAPFRYLVLGYRQPVDHRRPSAGTFEQRLTLLHRGFDRPLVLHTTGYNVRINPSRSEPARLVDGNQISVEQRFFAPSIPQPVDWRKLNIWQAATDHHRIVGALKALYPGRWLSTGASKGGMTSVYHRRFYPRDVDATVAYVAPNDVIDKLDLYEHFLRNVGTDPACRERLAAVQRTTLVRRDEFLTRLRAYAQANGFTYDRIMGSPEQALELLVLDMPFGFWQYQLQQECATVPDGDASTDVIWEFLDRVSGFATYTDQGTEPYVPYYYQAGTQLGAPTMPERHLRGLLRYPGSDVPRSFVPREIPMRFEPFVMDDINAWVRFHGSRLLFVYGENDPWSAEPFRRGPGTRDSYWYEVAGGNHGANIGQLPAAAQAEATAALQRWTGVAAAAAGARTTAATTRFIKGLDDVEDQPRRRPL